MNLKELLQFDNIVIQCHDNPDADAIASGYALFVYLRARGRQVRLIYGGSQTIQKSNLVLMVEMLDIPIEYVRSLVEEPELLLTVDCQYGEKNVQSFPARKVAVIDHHKMRPEDLPAMREVRDNYGACATIVWDMLCEEGFDAGEDERLSTALYYGLFMDTGKLQELRHPKDKDLRDALEFRCNRGNLFLFQNSNLSLEELRIAGQALSGYDYHPYYRFAIVEAQRCDPNILGVISDMLIEVDSVDVCIAYCMLDGGAKLSVRSCVRETRADELTAYVAEGLGSGGGHIRKSGGFLREDLLASVYESEYGSLKPSQPGVGVRRLLAERMERYFREQDLIHVGAEDVPDLSGAAVYQKRRLPIGYVRATDLYPAGTRVEVRMLEGDTVFTIREDTYFMIGVEAEVYKNNEEYFLSHNEPVDIPYQFQGEYAPTVHEAVSAVGFEAEAGSRKNLKDFARTCIPRDTSFIHARQLTRRTKVFVSWSDSYLMGVPGDWLVRRTEDQNDIYIVKKDIFSKMYMPLSEAQADLNDN
ncbi:DHH family phosphoesterase [Parablautia muri]|uniref:Recombinase RecJ n=1 Tax=Parablautia muri TaxID=2320879 RepID=A0A9X5BCE5_9FIRM|nr:recombinase RecJ [Parablautia muri]